MRNDRLDYSTGGRHASPSSRDVRAILQARALVARTSMAMKGQSVLEHRDTDIAIRLVAWSLEGVQAR